MDTTIETHGWSAVDRDLEKIKAATKPTSTSPVDVEAIELPGSSLVKSVLKYAEEQLPKPTFNHSMRVFYFAEAIRKQHFPSWKFSSETLLLTALLHDIGTSPANVDGTSRLSFEFLGGITSLQLLNNLGAQTSQAESVCETIIRHQDLGDTGKITSLTAVIQFATVLDNAGLHSELVHIETIRSVVAKYPRHKWTGCFASVVRDECKRKPWANTTRIDGFAEMVEANKLMEEFD